MRRRDLLARATALAAPLLAGCAGDGDGDGGGGQPAETTTAATDTATEATTATTASAGDTTTTARTTTAGTTTAETTTTETTTGTATTTAPSPDATVEMVETAFDPVRAEVAAGATVEWVNEDGFAHTVTSAQFSEGAADWELDARLESGRSTTHTFESAGAYEYYCTIHGKATMCGVVVVGGASYDGTLPCQDSDTTTTSGDDGGYY